MDVWGDWNEFDIHFLTNSKQIKKKKKTAVHSFLVVLWAVLEGAACACDSLMDLWGAITAWKALSPSRKTTAEGGNISFQKTEKKSEMEKYFHLHLILKT